MAASTDISPTVDRSAHFIEVLHEGEEIPGNFEVFSVEITHRANEISGAVLQLLDGKAAEGAFEASNSDFFLPGKTLELQIGYPSEEPDTAFTGIVVRHEVRIRSGNQPSFLILYLKSPAVKMTVRRKSAYYPPMTDQELMEGMLEDEYGITDHDIADMGGNPVNLVQYNVSDWDYIVSRAEANGCCVYTHTDGFAVQPPVIENEGVLLAEFGLDIYRADLVMESRNQYDTLYSHAWDYGADQPEVAEEEAAAPAFEEQGSPSASELAQVFGKGNYTLFHPAPLPQKELASWAEARLLKSRLSKIRGTLRMEGTGKIVPGDTLNLDGISNRFNGKAFVSGVTHQFEGHNWWTEIEVGLSETWASKQNDIVEPPMAGIMPPVAGLMTGEVIQLEGDPDNQFRVKVRLHLLDNDKSKDNRTLVAGGSGEPGIWARTAQPDAGDNRGIFFRPEIGDEVVVGFVANDPRAAVILGTFHSASKAPPFDQTDDNHHKGITTKTGLSLAFDDEKKAVVIRTSNENTLVLSEDDQGITLKDEHENQLLLNADGITVQSAGGKDLILKSGGNLILESQQGIELTAGSKLKATGKAGTDIGTSAAMLNIKGNPVNIN